ncbi:MAG: 8-amino-7-oxononanoate synthase [Phycisphaerales bacterium]|jgi:8-amino-7-oxononanoate synthase|nr:8-amino-7-oxononanoate synthase [Phycisphaerales bacterium]
MSQDAFDSLLFAALAARSAANLLRRHKTLRPLDAVHVEIDGVQYVNFSSNNYLGLTHHPRVIEAIAHAARNFGAGAAASPLITGHTTLHASAENALARWKGTESAVLLPSGYQANLAAVQTIAAVAEVTGKRVRFLLDKLAHASLIDAVRGSRLPLRVFAHNDLTKLDRLLNTRDDTDELQVVITESIFSMDGDPAPLRALADLKRQKPFLLLVDEAHGSGVYGPHGSGYAAEVGATNDVDLFIVTLSKSLGCLGGAVCASKNFCDALMNFGRPYLYSTSVPPMIPAAAEAALQVMRDEPHRQQRVRHLATRVREQLKLPPGDSPIIPILLGEESAAIAAADALFRDRLLVLPVRPPTVPRGTSRLRITLSCEHSDAEVDHLVASLSKLPTTG